MRLLLATICLNEAEHLPRLFTQHINWPDLVGWVFVEAADDVYVETNPHLVSPRGLSVDGTTDLLHSFATASSLVTYIPHGRAHHRRLDQGKVAARQCYLNAASSILPTHVLVLDADEYYAHDAQHQINAILSTTGHHAYVFKQRHIWAPAACHPTPSSIFSQEVVGGYWNVPHVRGWRYSPSYRYRTNHNWIEDGKGRYLTAYGTYRGDRLSGPQCVHLGYASAPHLRAAKHAYYIARGEGRESGRLGRTRRMYLDCRRAYENWQPGRPLPHGAQVIPYTGPIPECFHDRTPPDPDQDSTRPTADHTAPTTYTI